MSDTKKVPTPSLSFDSRQTLQSFFEQSSGRLSDLEREVKDPRFKDCSREHTKIRAATELASDRFILNSRLNDLRATIKRTEDHLNELKRYEIGLKAQAHRYAEVQNRYDQLA